MRYIITGGAGFIGSNTANHLLSQGHHVAILDNLSRPGSEKNLIWLREKYSEISFDKVDVRNYTEFEKALRQHQDTEVILHFAAQVAVTTSVTDPRQDFEINALGTMNVLEAIRQLKLDPIFIYTSTNKVYGEMENIRIGQANNRYTYIDLPEGIPEDMPLNFHSPYGCSKGAADQYVRDYYRIFGLRSVVFRQSCIYGPRQFGVEDQGWVAWFIIAAVLGWPITIYGDGCQVRDLLYVEDLIHAYERAIERIDVAQGQIYNIGGGAKNTLSVWSEFEPILSGLIGHPILVRYLDWRPGDQKIYISDISKAKHDLGWEPKISVGEGLKLLYQWVYNNQELFNR
jgi:CDP-paratose 2-epimerase